MATNDTAVAPAGEVDPDALADAFADLPAGREGVLPALQEIQGMYGYLPEAALDAVAEHFSTPLADVVGVATFYAQFSLEPRGEHTVSVCEGTACHVNGAGEVVEELQASLGVAPGEVTDDGQFTLTTVRCVGACGLAPVVTVDDEVHGDVAPADVTDLLAEYRDEGGA